MKAYDLSNALALSTIAFASYFDVYSHAHIFVGEDPWWNPAHLMLYAGFAMIFYGTIKGKPRGAERKLSLLGIVVIVAAAAFNEIWHRILLFGNPLPEPFPIEPPHALLAVGIIILGVAALLSPLAQDRKPDAKGRLVISFISGSLWLIVAGSAFYVGGAYSTSWAFLFAAGVASFSASLFLTYSASVSRKFGYATLSYLWFLLIYYAFFLTPADGLPLGVTLVILLDFVLVRGKRLGFNPRPVVLVSLALLYGFVYYPVLPSDLTLAINAGLGASAVGVLAEYAIETAAVGRLMKGFTDDGPARGEAFPVKTQ